MLATFVLCVPVVAGSVASVLALICTILWLRRTSLVASSLPPVTVLKPLFGADKRLHENLRSMCTQDYPDYEVVLSVQRLDDPAIEVIRAIAAEFPTRVRCLIVDGPPIANGKAENLARAYALARHDVIVISDSDVVVPCDYLRQIVAPLSNAETGCVCTLIRAAGADNFWERLELLSFNADFLPVLVLGVVTRAAPFCLGASTALRRQTIDAIGGFASLSKHMVEDAEMGRRIHALGLRRRFVPRFVTTFIELPTARAWWNYQVYWDQNARYASLPGFVALLFLKAVPFATVVALMRGFDLLGSLILLAAVAVRMTTAALFLRLCVREPQTVRALWLLPVRDLIAVAAWLAAAVRDRFSRRGVFYTVTHSGLIERS